MKTVSNLRWASLVAAFFGEPQVVAAGYYAAKHIFNVKKALRHG